MKAASHLPRATLRVSRRSVALVLALPLAMAIAAPADGSEWQQTFGGANDDRGYSVQQTTDGGYVVTGYTTSAGAGRADVYLVKTDASGAEVWSRTFGGARRDAGLSVRQTTDGGYIIAGSTYSFGAGAADVYLIKTDADGTELWSRTFGGAGDDRGYCVRQTTDGGYVIAGWTTSIGAGGYDVYLLKTDADGAEMWSRTFGGEGTDLGLSVQQTADGGYVVAGYTQSAKERGQEVYLLKTDADGTELWSRTFGGARDDRGYSVQQTTDGGYVIAGYTQSADSRGYDVYLIRTDARGTGVWSRTFGGAGTDDGLSVRQTSDGGYVIGGYTQSTGAGGYDVYLLKIDANGTEVWSRTFGGASTDDGLSVEQTSDGGYVIAGYTQSAGAGDYDVYLVKTEWDGTGLWSRTFGGGSRDAGPSVQQTTDGGYVIAGETQSFGAGDSDAYLIKTDPRGTEVWSQTFGGPSDDRGYSVQQTTDGGYIIAGSTTSVGAGDSDVYLVKTDARGTEVWSRTFGEAGSDGGYSVRQTTDGGYVVAGWKASAGTGTSDVYLVKTDASGTKVWSQTFGGSGSDGGYSVRQTTDGGYVIAGWTTSAGAGSADVYLIKTDASGAEVWSRTFGGAGSDGGYSVQQTTDGGYVVAGETYSFGAGSADVYLIKTDASGTEVWKRTFGGASDDRGYSVQQTTDGGYVIAGETYSFGAGGYDVHLIKTDPSGAQVWSRTDGGSGWEAGYSVQQTAAGGYVIAGETRTAENHEYDVYLAYYSMCGDGARNAAQGCEGSKKTPGECPCVAQ